MTVPDVSVVIPFFRGVDQLKRAVASVCAQTFDSFEIIVVSDDSPENLSGFAAEFPEVKIVELPQNSGPGVARNAGISRANGSFVAFLDSDDWWYPEKLAIQIPQMVESNAVWSHHPYDIVTDSGRLLRRVDNVDISGDVRDATLRSFRVQTSCMVIRRDVLCAEGFGFSDDRIGEDDALYRSLARNYPIQRTPHVLSAFVSHGSNAGFSPAIQLWSRWRTARNFSRDEWRELAALDRVAYGWVWLTAIALGVANPEQPKTGHRRLVIGAAYLPAWLLFRRPTRRRAART